MATCLLTHVGLVGEGGDPLVPTDGEELGLVEKVHDLRDLCIAAVGHALQAAAVHVVPHLQVM